MDLVSIAAIIAAVAFAVLVIFVCLTLKNVDGVITRLHTTVDKTNDALTIVTKDVDQLSVEVEALLNKANSLMDDVNGKLEKTDPLFVAIGEVGESVSEIQASTKKVGKTLSTSSIFKHITPFSRKKEHQATATSTAKKVEKAVAPIKQEKQPFEALMSKTPSQTAGEITIQKRG